MFKFILGNPGKSLWTLLCCLAIIYFDGRPDLQVILYGWAIFPTYTLYLCEISGIPHKWGWAVANFLLPWIAIWIFLILKDGKIKRQTQTRKLQISVKLQRSVKLKKRRSNQKKLT